MLQNLFWVYILCGPLALFAASMQPPRATHGVIDLRQHDFSVEAAELKGEWAFYWNELRVSDNRGDKATTFADAPRSWTGMQTAVGPLPGRGYATYSLVILLPELNAPLALSMFEQGTAVRVFANGKLMGERGRVGVDEISTVPDTKPLVLTLPAAGPELRLDLQIANQHYRKGGMWNVVKLGTDPVIRSGLMRRQWLEVFASGCLLIMFMYHLGVHFYYRRGNSSLLFALFCFTLFIRLVTTSARVLPEYLPAIPFGVYSRLEYLSWFLSVPLGIHFVEEVFGNLRFKKLVPICYTLAILFALTLLLPARLYSYTVLPSNLLFFGFMIWSLVELARLLRSDSKGVRLFLAGALVLALFTLNDILFNLEFIRIGQLGPFGMVVFILCQAIVTSRRSMTVFAEKERLQLQLNDQLQEVIRLRTRELANARVMSQLSQQQLTNVINNIPGMAYRCAPEFPWTMFFISNEVEKLTGYAASEFINDAGRTFASIMEPGDLDAMMQQELAGTPDRYRHNYRIITKYGGTVWIEDRGQRIYDDTGELLWLDGVMIDITALKQTEIELVDARDRAEAANQAKSQFLASMSHELRTPLHGILGMAAVLKDSGLNAEQTDLAGIIEDSGQVLLRQINSILDLAKVESGKLELENIEFDLRHLAAEMMPIIRTQARAKPVVIEMIMPESLDTIVLGDPTRLRQVLLNLLGNALKFTERGNITLEIASKAGQNGMVPYVFRIRDTGIGIDPGNLEIIFEPFRQADQSTTRRFGGTGLGLTISQQIVQAMGGHITVESKLSEGTVFTVEIPFRKPLEIG